MTAAREELVPPEDEDRVRFESFEADPAPIPPPESRSLVEDVYALIEDGKLYAEAELTFQKTRALFTWSRAKQASVYGAVAFTFGWLAMIGLTVGLILALTPLITAWGATAVVVGLLLIGAAILGSMAWQRVKEIIDAFSNRNKGSNRNEGSR